MIGMEVLEAGVDYVTASSFESKLGEGQSAKRFMERGLYALEEQMSLGNDKLPWSMAGFMGYRSGQAAVAYVGEAVLIRLSGECARRHFDAVYADATNVSRLDLMATYRLTGAWRDLSLVHLQEVREYADRYKPKMHVRRIDGGKHGNTLVLGRRISDWWGRIYDKHAESGLEYYRDCWRYEVEIKRRAAARVAQGLELGTSDKLTSFEAGAQWLRSNGVSLPGSGSPGLRNGGVIPPSNDGRRLAWLRDSVRSTVKLLCSHGLRAEVETALFGWELDKDSSDT